MVKGNAPGEVLEDVAGRVYRWLPVTGAVVVDEVGKPRRLVARIAMCDPALARALAAKVPELDGGRAW